ncbi:IclR family transcriptional regulator [Paenibacillus xerothermodurans]|uniref:IclR family transcriptional regulator n=1 Tax=Paenibacillus xerothermodurans TaxID=1977292 RepID=A0A2W1NF51_PAEXE|nr:IclR family transcriptional regulator [Paenibacillus xerothermodurans]PZE21691.1 IclR family transcriptional regulator [Paenibacillus xerothermodurans]
MAQPDGTFRTVSRIFAVLRLLSKKTEGLSFTEIITQFEDIPKSSMHNLLKQMHAHGYVCYNDRAKTYSIGGGMIELASSIVHHFTVKPLARPYLDTLGIQTGEDIYLGILSGEETVYIDNVKGTHPIRFDIPVGSRRQLYSTATGKLFLAHMSDHDLSRYLENKPLVPLTKRTITEPSELKEHLKAIRSAGISISYEENMDGIVGISAPIMDEFGRMAAGIVISVPNDRAVPSQVAFLVQHVKETAGQITRRVGGKVPTC